MALSTQPQHSIQPGAEILPCVFQLRITGEDAAGIKFADEVETRATLKHGMVILSQRNLIPGTDVGLEFAAAFTCGRVLAQLGLWDGQQLYAVEYKTDSSPLFKHDSATNRLSTNERLLLQCSICSGQEEFELNDIQLTVFRSTRSVLMGCKRCAGDSLWTAPTTLDDPNLMIGSQAYEQQHGAISPRNRTIDNRRYKRTAVKRVKACLRRANGGEDVVEVLDISRGGIRFLSYVDYPPDTFLQLAVPYMKEAENMFTAGRIVRVQCRPTVDIPGEFGLEFVRF
jgi:hypothetical protein